MSHANFDASVRESGGVSRDELGRLPKLGLRCRSAERLGEQETEELLPECGRPRQLEVGAGEVVLDLLLVSEDRFSFEAALSNSHELEGAAIDGISRGMSWGRGRLRRDTSGGGDMSRHTSRSILKGTPIKLGVTKKEQA